MVRKVSIRPFIVSFILLFFFGGGTLVADEQEIVRSLFQNAKLLFERGSLGAARVLLEEAIDLSPDYSETLFLLGKILSRDQATTFLGIPYLEKALLNNTWTTTFPAVADETLCVVLVRTRRYQEALNRINNLRGRRHFTANLEVTRALALYGLGDRGSGNNVLENALQLYPRDLTVYQTYIKMLIQFGNLTRANQLVARGRKEFPGEPVFIYFQFVLSTDIAQQTELFSQYVGLQGADPSLVLAFSGLKQARPDAATTESLIDFFLAKHGETDISRLQALIENLRPHPDLFKFLVSRLGTLAGEKTIDKDQDGFYEARYVFSRGNLDRVLFDDDQDGRAELQIELSHDTPVKIISEKTTARTIEYQYNEYPRLTTVVVRSPERTVTYELVPDALSFLPVTKLPDGSRHEFLLGLTSALRFPEENDVSRFAYASVERFQDTTLPVRQWELWNGLRRVLHEDTDHDGAFERRVMFDDSGKPLRGSSDMDQDGTYEIEELYANGVLIRVTYDEDGDGEADYFQDATGTLKEWDLNNDGIIDVITTVTADGMWIPHYTNSGILKRLQ